MLNYRPDRSAGEQTAMVLYLMQPDERKNGTVQREPVGSGWSYAAKLGRETILLEVIEFRILRFLADRPYRAFTPKRIAQAVQSEKHPVTAETLNAHVNSLRQKLGFFGDYVQSVPHIGFRFRA